MSEHGGGLHVHVLVTVTAEMCGDEEEDAITYETGHSGFTLWPGQDRTVVRSGLWPPKEEAAAAMWLMTVIKEAMRSARPDEAPWVVPLSVEKLEQMIRDFHEDQHPNEYSMQPIAVRPDPRFN